MESIKKYKKLTLALIFIIFITISTHVGAYSQTYSTFSPTYSNVIDGHFNPYKADGSLIFYCIQHGSPYKVNSLDKYTEGSTYESWCELANKAPSAPWSGKRYTMTYNYEETVVDRNYQDAAYVIASAVESNQISDMGTQWSMWATTLNIGKSDTNKGTWGNEAVEYRNFYNKIHFGTTDIYNSKVYDKTNISQVTVNVDQTLRTDVNPDGQTYIVGPFTIEYPKGEYGTQKWSYITNITLLNQENVSMGNVISNTIHIVDSNGTELRDSINNNNFPNSNESFYVKFSSTLGNMNNIKLKVDFKYLESCSAKLVKYDGTLTSWVWEKFYDGICTDEKHQHKGTQAVKYTWKLTKTSGGKPQKLVAYDGDGKKNYQTASLIVVPEGIDLTMKIAGQVFLDRDSGKVNTGNNIMDGNNEALPGVEVVLYYANGNLKDQIVTKTSKLSKYHQHTEACYQYIKHGDNDHIGSPETGGGCYTKRNPDHPYHIGNWEEGGECYQGKITHVHTGNEKEYGGCYIVPVKHEHTDACYNIKEHTHSDDCYTIVKSGTIESKASGDPYGQGDYEEYYYCGECGWTKTYWKTVWKDGERVVVIDKPRSTILPKWM